jgi:hypothetical protein
MSEVPGLLNARRFPERTGHYSASPGTLPTAEMRASRSSARGSCDSDSLVGGGVEEAGGEILGDQGGRSRRVNYANVRPGPTVRHSAMFSLTSSDPLDIAISQGPYYILAHRIIYPAACILGYGESSKRLLINCELLGSTSDFDFSWLTSSVKASHAS